MIQITCNIASGNKEFEPLFGRLNQFLVDRHIELGFNPKDLIIITDCNNYDMKDTLKVKPLQYGYFNFRVRHYNYIHAVKILGLQNKQLFLRDSDTIVVKKFDFPVENNQTGFVQWKYRNLNCGAIYIGSENWNKYENMINLLPITYDEKWISDFVRNQNYLKVLGEEYNFDLRNNFKENLIILHFCRKFSGIIEPEVKSLLEKYNLLSMIKRKMSLFANYKDL